MTCRLISEANKGCVEEFHFPVAVKVNDLVDLSQVKYFWLTWEAETPQNHNMKTIHNTDFFTCMSF